MIAEQRRRGRAIRKARRAHPRWSRPTLHGAVMFGEVLASVNDTFGFFSSSLDAYVAEHGARLRVCRALNYRDPSGDALRPVSGSYKHPRPVLTGRQR